MRSWLDWFSLVAIICSVALMALLVVVQVRYTATAETAEVLTSEDEAEFRQEARDALTLTFVSATVSGVVALVLAIPTGYALARWHFPGAWLVEAFLLIPVTMSPMALGVALLLVFRDPPGLWLARYVVFEVPGIVVAQFFVAYAFSVLVIRTTFSGIDVRLEQVARFLGCTPWQAFRRVTLPLARNGIVAGFVLGWARALGDFGATATLAGAVEGKTETVPVAIYLNMARVSISRAVVLSIVLTFVTVVGLIAVRLLVGGRRS